jgi:hypothetical protein
MSNTGDTIDDPGMSNPDSTPPAPSDEGTDGAPLFSAEKKSFFLTFLTQQKITVEPEQTDAAKLVKSAALELRKAFPNCMIYNKDNVPIEPSKFPIQNNKISGVFATDEQSTGKLYSTRNLPYIYS